MAENILKTSVLNRKTHGVELIEFPGTGIHGRLIGFLLVGMEFWKGPGFIELADDAYNH